MVLVLASMAAVVSTAFLAAQKTSGPIAQNIVHHASARGIAESGLELTIRYLQTDPTWRADQPQGSWITDQSMAGGTFSVWVTDEDADFNDDPTDAVTVVCVGTVNGVSHRVTAYVRPGGNAKVLLLVAGSTNLNSDDRKKKQWFEGWGFVVQVIADNDSQSEFNTALEGADVVYISETVNSGTVGTKLTDTRVGIVCEEGFLPDELKLSSSNSGGTNGDSLSIVDAGHAITGSFGVGSLTFGITSIEQRTYSNLASGVRVLAETGGSPVLIVADRGDLLVDNSSAPGRRVCMPIAQSGFDPEKLNADGLELVRRSVMWAAVPASPPLDMLAYWPVDENPAHGTSVDATARGRDLWMSSLRATSGKIGRAPRSYGYTNMDDDDGEDYLNGLDGFTLALWVRPTDSGLDRTIVSGSTTERFDEQFSLRYAVSNILGGGTQVLKAVVPIGGDVMLHYESASNVHTTDWQHLVWTWDSANGIKLYINGQLDTPTYHATAAGDPMPAGGTLTGLNILQFGPSMRNAPNYSHFRGWWDDIRLYGRAVNAAEAYSLFKHLPNPDDATAIVLYDFELTQEMPSLVSHWKLDGSGTGGGVAGANDVILRNDAVIDSYDSRKGPYSSITAGSSAIVSTNRTSNKAIDAKDRIKVKGDAYIGAGGDPNTAIYDANNGITGIKGELASNVVIPSVSSPGSMPASEGNQTLTISGAQVWNTDRKFGSLTLQGTGTLTITGDLRVHATGTLRIKGDVKIVIPAGNSLELYTSTELYIQERAEVNNDSTASDRLKLYRIGGGTKNIWIEDDAKVAAIMFSSDDIVIRDRAIVYGSVLGQDDFRMYNNAQMHQDLSLPAVSDVAARALDENETQAGVRRNGVTGGAAGHGDGGDAYGFDGVDDYVEVPHHAKYLLSEGSVSFWFYADNTSGRQGLISKESNLFDDGGHLNIELSGSTLEARIQSTTTSYTVSKSGMSANRWYHVTLGWGGPGLRLHVDGSLSDSDSYTGGLDRSAGGTTGNIEPWTLGVGQTFSGDQTVNGWDAPFQGRIDDVRVYDQNLNATQAANLAAGNDPGVQDRTHLVQDKSGYGNPADLTVSDVANVNWLRTGGLDIATAVQLLDSGSSPKLYAALIGRNDITVEALYRTSSVSGTAILGAYQRSASSSNVGIMRHGQQTRIFSNNWSIPSSDFVNTTSLWHVVMTWDGTTLKLYRNAIEDYSYSVSGSFTGWDSTARMTLANDLSGSAPFLGELYRFAIYDQAVDASGVERMLYGGSPNGESTLMHIEQWIEMD